MPSAARTRATVRAAVSSAAPALTVSSHDAQQGYDHEDGQEQQARERDEPGRDGGDKTAGSAGRHGRVPGAPAAGYREGQAVGPAYRLFSDELVAVHLDDADISKASGAEVRITQIDDAVDLRGLPGRAPLEGEGGIGARAIHEDRLPRPEEGLLSRPGQPVLKLLHLLSALRHDLGSDLPRQARRGRPLLEGVREHAQAIETHVLHEAQEIVEGGVRLTREAHEHGGADGEARD